MSVVVPIGVLVAVAIVCIIVAVITSAQRADVVAIEHEQQLFSRALANYGERVLRQVESVASADTTVRNIRRSFDADWASRNVGRWLDAYFNHDQVLILDGTDTPIYSHVRHRANDSRLPSRLRVDFGPVIDYMRGRDPGLHGAIRINQLSLTEGGAQPRSAIIRRLLGRPAVIAAAAVGPIDGIPRSRDTSAPIIMSVKFIDDAALADIASQLQLTNLRRVEQDSLPPKDIAYDLAAPDGSIVTRFAWTPKQPGAEIVNNVVPFIAVAFAGFGLLAAFVLRYMRRTAAAIAAGESRLRHLAMHDPLCGLPNRIFFGERLEAVIDEVRAGSAPAAVFYIDLDHFKDVNDTLGHHIGDDLIRNVTLRLSNTLRTGDLVARLGGDEFAVISSMACDTDAMTALAQRMISAICAPYFIGGQNIIIGASIGIAMIDKSCGTATDIMRYADMALYRAKNEGRNRACVYDAAMDADLSTRKLLEADLREAIDNDHLELLYQPIVNKSGETVVGIEALCRWKHFARGNIAPTEFIAIAEHSGLIIDLGNWVLHRACSDAKAWPELTVAVNVSSLQFRRTDFVDVVERILKETQFDPSRLELELTESVLLGNLETAETAMLRLRALGVRLALDDFGTGYSSLLYLRRFPFDKLKIDRSFVRSIEKAADAAAIVHAIVSLGRGLGMKVTAEGVETADQQLFLRAAGVHAMQGFRFGKPARPLEISARLQSPGAFHPVELPTALAS
ncbi:MAG TPA: EAL domain-containing protein [Pseudolabrys sp.]|nr:EAL domain-containing protein [Pseudolabrys sp.]